MQYTYSYSLQKYKAYPLFEYIFGNEENKDVSLSVQENAFEGEEGKDIKEEIIENEKNEIKIENDVKNAEKLTRQRLNKINVDNGTPSVGFLTGVLNHGVRGLKSVIDGSTNLTRNTISGIGQVSKFTIDQMQEAIDAGAKRPLDAISNWSETMDSYRRAMSAISQPNADKAHKLTISTSSKMPLTTVTKFVNQYLPSGSTTGSLPEITGIDFSKFWKK